MEKIRLAIIGLGCRGLMMLRDNFINFDEVDFVALCDEYEDRIEQAAALIRERRPDAPTPFTSTDYRQILAREDVDAVYVATAWESHVMIAIDSMKAGKATAMEVGGAFSLDECYRLVRTYEETQTPFMFMENCCYDRAELLSTAMARDGLFGTIVHCSGAYSHDLRGEITGGNLNRHYRLRNYANRNCENYPTHELGPIARLLNINRGNRMVSLVSVASKACGLREYVEEKKLYEQDPTLKDMDFAQGDIVNTIITCAGGETILLKLDTTLPRPYNRDLTIRGTKGFYEMANHTVYLDGMWKKSTPHIFYKEVNGNAKDFEEDYLPDLWLHMTEEDKKAGHGGMDGILFAEFLRALREGREMPIDVYDAAAWMCISALSEQSIALGGSAVPIPDFTDGKWLIRKPVDVFPLGKKHKE